MSPEEQVALTFPSKYMVMCAQNRTFANRDPFDLFGIGTILLTYLVRRQSIMIQPIASSDKNRKHGKVNKIFYNGLCAWNALGTLENTN